MRRSTLNGSRATYVPDHFWAPNKRLGYVVNALLRPGPIALCWRTTKWMHYRAALIVIDLINASYEGWSTLTPKLAASRVWYIPACSRKWPPSPNILKFDKNLQHPSSSILSSRGCFQTRSGPQISANALCQVQAWLARYVLKIRLTDVVFLGAISEGFWSNRPNIQ